MHEMFRCNQLGLDYLVLHPGSIRDGLSQEAGIEQIAHYLNKCFSQVQNVKIALETMAGQGNYLGYDFQQLQQIINLVEDKERVGVCIDTCHIFAAGYKLETVQDYEKTMADFNDFIGFDKLLGVHLNDSKGPWGCRKDLHARIGEGKIGKMFFQNFMNDKRFNDIPIIMETKGEYTQEINFLNSLLIEK